MSGSVGDGGGRFSVWLAGTVRAVQVFADGICSGDEAEFAVLAQLGIRGVGRIGCQNQDRTGLV